MTYWNQTKNPAATSSRAIRTRNESELKDIVPRKQIQHSRPDPDELVTQNMAIYSDLISYF